MAATGNTKPHLTSFNMVAEHFYVTATGVTTFTITWAAFIRRKCQVIATDHTTSHALETLWNSTTGVATINGCTANDIVEVTILYFN